MTYSMSSGRLNHTVPTFCLCGIQTVVNWTQMIAETRIYSGRLRLHHISYRSVLNYLFSYCYCFVTGVSKSQPVTRFLFDIQVVDTGHHPNCAVVNRKTLSRFCYSKCIFWAQLFSEVKIQYLSHRHMIINVDLVVVAVVTLVITVFKPHAMWCKPIVLYLWKWCICHQMLTSWARKFISSQVLIQRVASFVNTQKVPAWYKHH